MKKIRLEGMVIIVGFVIGIILTLSRGIFFDSLYISLIGVVMWFIS